MHYRILTQNGSDNRNIDDARNYYFNAGMRDGIVKGALNEGTFTVLQSNEIFFDTCELIISGHRFVIDEAWSKTFSSIPSQSERHAVIAQVVVDDNEHITFDLIDQPASTALIKTNLFKNLNGAGIYQAEIGRFTLNTNNTITDVVRTIDTITGGGTVDSELHWGTVTAYALGHNEDPEADFEQRYDEEQGWMVTDVSLGIPSGSIDNMDETLSPTSHNAIENQAVTNALNNKANTNDNSQQLVVRNVTAQNVSSNQTSDTKLNHLGIDWNTDNQNVGWVNYDRSADTLDICNEYGDINLIPRKEEDNVLTPQSVNIQGKLNAQGNIYVENNGIYIKDDHGNNKMHIWHSNINNNDHIDFNGNRLFIYGQNPVVIQSSISDGNSSYGVTVPNTTGWTGNKTIATKDYVDNLLVYNWSPATLSSKVTGKCQYCKIGNFVYVQIRELKIAQQINHGDTIISNLPINIGENFIGTIISYNDSSSNIGRVFRTILGSNSTTLSVYYSSADVDTHETYNYDFAYITN